MKIVQEGAIIISGRIHFRLENIWNIFKFNNYGFNFKAKVCLSNAHPGHF